MKRVAIGIIVMGFMLAGCNRAVAEPLPTPTPPGEPTLTTPTNNDITLTGPMPFPALTPTLSPTTVQATSINVDDMPGFTTETSPAMAPAQLDIANFRLGATAKWEILIHNGDGLKNKLLQVTTEVEETTAAIPFNVVLANSGLLDIISIESLILKRDAETDQFLPDPTKSEYLEAVAYDNNNKLLTIKGFTPQETRVVKITYRAISAFTVFCKVATNTKAGYDKVPKLDKWLQFDKSEVLLRPFENGSSTVTLALPDVIADNEAEYVTIAPLGLRHLQEKKDEYYNELLLTLGRDYGYKKLPKTATNPDWINPNIEKKSLEQIELNPVTSFLQYMAENQSVFKAGVSVLPEVMADSLLKGYVTTGDIRTGSWEFWIGVTEKSAGQNNQVTTQIALCSRTLVTMLR